MLDHPRIRGEHAANGKSTYINWGIIPAYAGSTDLRMEPGKTYTGSSPHTRGAQSNNGNTSIRIGDHPRIRGEHREGLARRRAVQGIIPAYAGSTQDELAKSPNGRGSSPHTRGAPNLHHGVRLRAWDHPRIRGEHNRERRRVALMVADHPRIRGEHLPPGGPAAAVDGIIPAYAGSTRYRAS